MIQPLFRFKDTAILVLPLLGIVSIFWWSFSRGIPTPFWPLLSIADAANLFSGISIHVIAAIFFSRVMRVFLHYWLTISRGYIPGANKKKVKEFWRKIIYLINLSRRFLRTRSSFVEVLFGFYLFSIFLFGKVNLALFLVTILISYLAFMGLYSLFFRVRVQSTFFMPPVPFGASPDRISKFKISWIVTSLILASFIFGSALRLHREENSVCIKTSEEYINASVVLAARDTLIIARHRQDNKPNYSALPFSALEKIDADMTNCVVN
ncbi:hypothetical protein [Roseinatronobacter bogoriensis]|uniref:hypothetical protein n=1 Tax=Roseinatronobacter bogoriensis TaxID=119542 RepID=UPI00106299B1|nr:hypothetical protein [Rhodobaca]MBB4206472.1 hypothetical protein [Rhodobaca bogoriensis DSM 18756]TDW41216.1 hypothetical protein LY39_00318 [Rhodobaca barguzinensis]TDY74606.1 hypothetical protein EV660_101647 [Rhodobaca bogoriensis DSM 18756]